VFLAVRLSIIHLMAFARNARNNVRHARIVRHVVVAKTLMCLPVTINAPRNAKLPSGSLMVFAHYATPTVLLVHLIRSATAVNHPSNFLTAHALHNVQLITTTKIQYVLDAQLIVLVVKVN
jgi:hypothetical protein